MYISYHISKAYCLSVYHVICNRTRQLRLTHHEIQVEHPMVGGNKGQQLLWLHLTMEGKNGCSRVHHSSYKIPSYLLATFSCFRQVAVCNQSLQRLQGFVLLLAALSMSCHQASSVDADALYVLIL